MKVCRDQREDALDFASRTLSLRFPGGATWLANRFDDGRLAAVVIFQRPEQRNCTMHVAAASSQWATPEFLQAVFRYPFLSLDCLRVTATVMQSNFRCCRLLQHLGFQLEGCLRGFPEGNLLVFGMLKEECKWVELSTVCSAGQKSLIPTK